MRKLILILATGVIMISCGGEEVVTEEMVEIMEIGDPAYEPFPNGYGYMENTDSLEKAVVDKNMAYIREHSWSLWAGIMQPADSINWPIWYTWQNTFGAFINDNPTITLQSQTLIHQSIKLKGDVIWDTLNLSLPLYPLNQHVIDSFASKGVLNDDNTGIIAGKHFVPNGDIMIPTESLSMEAFDWIRKDKLYTKAKLDSMHDNNEKIWAPQKYIVTKHMYWPIKDSGVSALPVWKDDYYAETYAGYAGYETWDELVGVDPSGTQTGDTVSVSYLYGVS